MTKRPVQNKTVHELEKVFWMLTVGAFTEWNFHLYALGAFAGAYVASALICFGTRINADEEGK